MLNQVIVVGRLVRDPELIEKENKKSCCLTLAVSRSFKNANGEYETDFIDCVLWEGVAESTVEYCKKGDVIGVRGRLQTQIINDKKELQVIADKITFLSSKRSDDLSD